MTFLHETPTPAVLSHLTLHSALPLEGEGWGGGEAHHEGDVMPSEAMKPKIHLFYGWYVLAAGFLILFFNAGARFSIGVMFKPMIGEFGWSRAAMSLGFFLC